MAREFKDDSGTRRVTGAVTIRRDRRTTYAAWRDLTRLPLFMRNVLSVTEEGERSHWVVSAPGGSVEWDATITDDVPGERLAWRTTGDADVEHAGELRFEPSRQGKGTEVYVSMSWQPPAGVLGAVVARVTGDDPAKQLAEDLWRFKQLMEVGAVPTTQGQSRGAAQREAMEREQDEPPPFTAPVDPAPITGGVG